MQYTEQMSNQQAVLQLDEPKEDVDVFTETGMYETESKDIFGSGKKLSHMDVASELTDSRTNSEEDFITGNFPYLFFLLIKIIVTDN